MPQASEDDVIPFTMPVTTSTGEIVTSITVAKGTTVSSPIRAVNLSEEFWGPDAKEFKPERWLEDADNRSKEISGHRHLLTFADGPRICLGRSFALTEFKVRLSCPCRLTPSLTQHLLAGSIVRSYPQLYVRVVRWPQYGNRHAQGDFTPTQASRSGRSYGADEGEAD